jgi:hypothetical protein
MTEDTLSEGSIQKADHVPERVPSGSLSFASTRTAPPSTQVPSLFLGGRMRPAMGWLRVCTRPEVYANPSCIASERAVIWRNEVSPMLST